MAAMSMLAVYGIYGDHVSDLLTQDCCDQPIQGKTCQAVRHVLRFLRFLQ